MKDRYCSRESCCCYCCCCCWLIQFLARIRCRSVLPWRNSWPAQQCTHHLARASRVGQRGCWDGHHPPTPRGFWQRNAVLEQIKFSEWKNPQIWIFHGTTCAADYSKRTPTKPIFTVPSLFHTECGASVIWVGSSKIFLESTDLYKTWQGCRAMWLFHKNKKFHQIISWLETPQSCRSMPMPSKNTSPETLPITYKIVWCHMIHISIAKLPQNGITLTRSVLTFTQFFTQTTWLISTQNAFTVGL